MKGVKVGRIFVQILCGSVAQQEAGKVFKKQLTKFSLSNLMVKRLTAIRKTGSLPKGRGEISSEKR